MRSPVAGIVILILLFLGAIVAYSSIFTVSQTEQALVVRLGRPVDVVSEPGLNFKAPFIDTVISIDKRILDLENPSQEVIASDQKRLVVDAFARYRIKNPLRFYQSIGSIQAANIQLTTLLNAALRRVLGEVSFITVVRDEREGLMTRIRDQLDREADQYGIQVVGFWTNELGGSSDQLIYILAYDSLADREKKWNAFVSDKERLAKFAETEKNGPLVARLTAQMLRPTAYSPMQ